jgi:hypothetical protein
MTGQYKAYFPLIANQPLPAAVRSPLRGLAGLVRRPELEAVTGQILGRCAMWHNWTVSGAVEGLEYIPMLWGRGPWRNSGIEDCLAHAVNVLGNGYAGKFLWLNEPNDHQQANLRPDEAADFYVETIAAFPHAQLIGPQMSFYNEMKWEADANWLRAWHDGVWQRTGQGARLWATAVHNYVQDTAGHIQAHENWVGLLNELGYGRLPLWVTEWGISNDFGDAAERVAAICAYYEGRNTPHFYYINANWGDDTGFDFPTYLQDESGLTAAGRGWMGQ